MGIGHVRYPTAGSASAQEAQPFFVNSPLGVYLIHNGNLTNVDELREALEGSQSFFSRHLRTDSDSEARPGTAWASPDPLRSGVSECRAGRRRACRLPAPPQRPMRRPRRRLIHALYTRPSISLTSLPAAAPCPGCLVRLSASSARHWCFPGEDLKAISRPWTSPHTQPRRARGRCC